MRDIAILVPGPLHEHAVRRIGERFEAIPIEQGDPDLLAGDAASRIRGIASGSAVPAALIDALPELEIIAFFGVGYDAVDAAHAAKRQVTVTNTPDVLNDEVADTTIGLLLNTLRELPKAEAWLRAGHWAKEGNYPLTPMTLRGRKVGIFGLGRIGKAIAHRLEAFGVPVSYHNRRKVGDVSYPWHASLLDLARSVDTLISVVPGGAATDKAISADVLEALGPDGVFINVGRGSAVDEEALAAALASGTIRAAGLDVFAREPHVPQAFFELDNLCMLPHVASASVHTRRAMADLVADNLVAWFDGRGAITPVPESAGLPAPGGRPVKR